MTNNITFFPRAHIECVVFRLSMTSVFISLTEDWWHRWQIRPARLRLSVPTHLLMKSFPLTFIFINILRPSASKPQQFHMRKILQPQQQKIWSISHWKRVVSGSNLAARTHHRRWVAPKWNFHRVKHANLNLRSDFKGGPAWLQLNIKAQPQMTLRRLPQFTYPGTDRLAVRDLKIDAYTKSNLSAFDPSHRIITRRFAVCGGPVLKIKNACPHRGRKKSNKKTKRIPIALPVPPSRFDLEKQ